MANLLEHTTTLVAHGVKPPKETLMAITSKHLCYYRDGTIYNINLYDSVADVGANYLAIESNIGTVYAPLGLPTDTYASHLRIQKNSITWAILSSIATATQQFITYDLITEITNDDLCPITTSVNNPAYGSISPPTSVTIFNTSATFTAAASTGYSFTSWTIATATSSTSNTNNPLTLTITEPTHIRATFSPV